MNSSYKNIREILENIDNQQDAEDIIFQMLYIHAYLNYKLNNFRHNYYVIDDFIVTTGESHYNLLIGEHKFNLDNFISLK